MYPQCVCRHTCVVAHGELCTSRDFAAYTQHCYILLGCFRSSASLVCWQFLASFDLFCVVFSLLVRLLALSLARSFARTLALSHAPSLQVQEWVMKSSTSNNLSRTSSLLSENKGDLSISCRSPGDLQDFSGMTMWCCTRTHSVRR